MSYSHSVISSPNAPVPHLVTVRVSQIPPGTLFYHPVYKKEQQVLTNSPWLSAGTVFTFSHRSDLVRQAISYLRIHQADLLRIKEQTDAFVEETITPRRSSESLTSSDSPFIERLVRKQSGYRPEFVLSTGKRDRMKELAQLQTFWTTILSERVFDLPILETLIKKQIDELITDVDQFVLKSVFVRSWVYNKRGTTSPNEKSSTPRIHVDTRVEPLDSLVDRAWRTSRLALALGLNLHLSQRELMDLFSGTLVGSLGAGLKDSLLTKEFVDNDAPGLCWELIEQLQKFEKGGRAGSDLAIEGQTDHSTRIAVVAFEYISQLAAIRKNGAGLPFHVIQYLIQGVRQERFDPQVVRALLRTLSLYPIGSFIELSDGCTGQVIRTNGEQYTRPLILVRALQPDTRTEMYQYLNLMNSPSIRILNAVQEPKQQQTHLPHLHRRAECRIIEQNKIP